MLSHAVRPLLLAVVTLLGAVAVPARAEDPTVLVTGRADGTLMRVELVRGRVATTRILVAPRADTWLVPTQARGTAISYVSVYEGRATYRTDVGIADATTGALRPLSRDGRSSHVLMSPDGRYRYVTTYSASSDMGALVRVDAAGRRKTLVAPSKDLQLSGSGISPDGRTIYVAAAVGLGPSRLLAVDTRTGARRVVAHDAPYQHILNVVVSPDGHTLAVTFSVDETFAALRVALVPAAGGAARMFETVGDLHASAFTAGGAVLLSRALHPVDTNALPGIALGDVTTGLVTPIANTNDLFQAVAVD